MLSVCCNLPIAALDNATDIDQVHLTSLIFDWSVDAHKVAVWAESRVCINPPFAGIFFGEMKLTEIDSLPGGKMIQVGRLQAVWSLRVGVIEKPLIARQVRQMSSCIQDAMADFLNVPASLDIFEQEIPPIRVPQVFLRL